MTKKDFADKLHDMQGYSRELTACSEAFKYSIKQLLKAEQFILSPEWYTCSCADFMKTSLPQVKLSAARQTALEKIFNTAVSQALELKALMEATDKQIISMVYEQMEEEAAIKNSSSESLSRLQKQRAAVLQDSATARKRVKS